MGKTSNKLATALGSKSKDTAPRPIEDYQADVGRTQGLLNASRETLAHLDQQRATIYLDGGDVAGFHERLERVTVETETYRQAWETAKQRLANARVEKYQRALEADAEECRDIHQPGAEQALLDWHRATLAVIEAGERLAMHKQAIQGNDLNVKQNDRPDLVVDYNALRTRVAAELPSEHNEEPMPVRFGRGGDPDLEEGRALFLTRTRDGQRAYAKWQERMRGTINEGIVWKDHETDEAFNLRMLSWSGRRNSSSVRNREDPFKAAGAKAITVIKSLIDDREAYERDRNGREIQIQSYVDPNGDQHIKTVFTDGGRKPREPGTRAF